MPGILGGGVAGDQPSLGSTILSGGVAADGSAFAGMGSQFLAGTLLAAAAPQIALQSVVSGYRLGTSGLFWASFNLYRERGDLLSIYRGEAQTVEVRPSARPARIPGGLLFGPVRFYPQPYFDIGITGKSSSGIDGVSVSGGSGAPAEVPKRTNNPSSRRGVKGRRPRYCPKHRSYDWCWAK